MIFQNSYRFDSLPSYKYLWLHFLFKRYLKLKTGKCNSKITGRIFELKIVYRFYCKSQCNLIKITGGKMSGTSKVLLLLVAIIVYANCLAAAGGAVNLKQFKSGTESIIDLDKISSSAYENGKIFIRFPESAAKYLEQVSAKSTISEIADLQIPELAATAAKYGIVRYKPVLSALYKIPGKHHEYKERHKEWGLHLWYEVEFNRAASVKDIINDIVRTGIVSYAEPVFKISRDYSPAADKKKSRWTPNDPQLAAQWHYINNGQDGGTADADIDLDQAWEIQKGNPAVIVAVFDGGIDYQHEDLAANIWAGIGPEGTATKKDDHGTHVAGTIAAVNNNGKGVSGIAGGNNGQGGVKLMSIDIFEGTHGLSLLTANVYAADNGACVSQNSWSYTDEGVFPLTTRNGIDYFNTNGGGTALAGGLTVFAAGNRNVDGASYPAFYEGTMAVASTDRNDLKSTFSNYGNWVEISAPGSKVCSTFPDNTYSIISGTSMACPHVSGTAALVVSQAPGLLTANELRNILRNSADNHYSTGSNNQYVGKLGSGRLNAHKALLVLNGLIKNPAVFTAAPNGPSSINLSWTKNSSGNNVMIAVNNSNNFGAPSGSYSAGQSISGGGTVIYRGSAANFSHSNLNSFTNYYYRAWSYNASGSYSPGSDAKARTAFVTITSYPWTETFEDDSPTRDIWLNEQLQSDVEWRIYKGSSIGAAITNAHSGSKNAYFGGTWGFSKARYIGPKLNLTGLTTPVLSFWYAQEKGTLDKQNELKVFYRTSPSAGWVLLFHETGNIVNWTRKTINLPNASTEYQFCFEGLDNWGKAIVVDDVTVSNGGGIKPSATTGTVTLLNSSSATLNGVVNANNNETSVTFEYGTTYSLCNSVNAAPGIVSGTENKSVSSAISGLTANKVYYYRLKTVNTHGTTLGNTQTFQTTTGGTLNPATNFSAVIYNLNNIKLQWTAPANQSILLTGYLIYRNNSLLSTVNNPDSTVYRDKGMNSGSYTYTVTALYGNSESLPTGSSTVNVVDNDVIATFPWTETFEDNSISRSKWTQVKISGTKSWTFNTGAGGIGLIQTAKNGIKNARFTSTLNGPNITQLITPLLNLSGVSNPALSFWYGQQNDYGDQNELKIYYRTTAAGSWILLAHYPQQADSWTHVTLSLPAPSASYQIAFEGIDKFGHPNVLDDVTVFAGQPSHLETTLPAVTALQQNYPNPFNPKTVINFELQQTAKVRLSVYNTKGELIKVLIDRIENSGRHNIEFDGSSYHSGMYFYRLKTENSDITKKMILLK